MGKVKNIEPKSRDVGDDSGLLFSFLVQFAGFTQIQQKESDLNMWMQCW